eukprot:scaffold6334_cov137-Isochrysis_galbana.AAC.2
MNRIAYRAQQQPTVGRERCANIKHPLTARAHVTCHLLRASLDAASDAPPATAMVRPAVRPVQAGTGRVHRVCISHAPRGFGKWHPACGLPPTPALTCAQPRDARVHPHRGAESQPLA